MSFARRMRRRMARKVPAPPKAGNLRSFSFADAELFIGGNRIQELERRTRGRLDTVGLVDDPLKQVPLRPEQLAELVKWFELLPEGPGLSAPVPDLIQQLQLIAFDESDKLDDSPEARLKRGQRVHEHLARVLRMQEDTLNALDQRQARNEARTPYERAQHAARVEHLETMLRRSKKTGMLNPEAHGVGPRSCAGDMRAPHCAVCGFYIYSHTNEENEACNQRKPITHAR